MSAVSKVGAILLALAAAGCSGAAEQQQQPNQVANVPADIEVLPPDESVATPTNQLENGVAQPNVNEALVNGS